VGIRGSTSPAANLKVARRFEHDGNPLSAASRTYESRDARRDSGRFGPRVHNTRAYVELLSVDAFPEPLHEGVAGGMAHVMWTFQPRLRATPKGFDRIGT
jgi:hypothetical protein